MVRQHWGTPSYAAQAMGYANTSALSVGMRATICFISS